MPFLSSFVVNFPNVDGDQKPMAAPSTEHFASASVSQGGKGLT
jgi:hypothetical protein